MTIIFPATTKTYIYKTQQRNKRNITFNSGFVHTVTFLNTFNNSFDTFSGYDLEKVSSVALFNIYCITIISSLIKCNNTIMTKLSD